MTHERAFLFISARVETRKGSRTRGGYSRGNLVLLRSDDRFNKSLPRTGYMCEASSRARHKRPRPAGRPMGRVRAAGRLGLRLPTMPLQRALPLSAEKGACGLVLVSAGVQVQTKSGPHPLGASASRRTPASRPSIPLSPARQPGTRTAAASRVFSVPGICAPPSPSYRERGFFFSPVLDQRAPSFGPPTVRRKARLSLRT